MNLSDETFTLNYHDRWIIFIALEQLYFRLLDDDEKLLEEMGEQQFDWTFPRARILMNKFKNN